MTDSATDSASDSVTGEAAAPAPGATPSQTIGPFFRIGTEWLHSPSLVDAADAGAPGVVTLHGSVCDGDGMVVPDAVVELWQAATGRFGRCLVDGDGAFRFALTVAGALDVTIFARGLLNRLVTRVVLSGDPTAGDDHILALVPEARRSTLVAVADGPGSYRWDVRLQGEGETVFLVW